MRRYVFGLLLPVLFGCSGQNVVAGEAQTKAEQLDASVPSWCDTTCSRLMDCSKSAPCDCGGDACDCVGVDANCPSQCKASFAAFTGSEACAAIGERIKKCIDRASCTSLSQGNPCALTEAEHTMCPDPNQSSDVPSSTGSNGYSYAGSASTGGDSGPSASGGTVSYAGSANIPAAGTSTGGAYAGPSGPPVTCPDSYGTGGGSPGSGGSHVICEEGRDGCSDGHAYSWICVESSQGEHACSCLVDSGVSGGFDPGASCPDVSQVNSGCGWNLTQ